MAFVIDASVVLAWLLPDEQSAAADRLVERLVRTRGHAPPLLLLETANALLQAERRTRIAAGLADELLGAVSALPLILEPASPAAVARAHAIARQHGLTLYDATYLDLAEQRRLPLASFDAAMNRVAAERGIEVAEA